MKIRPADRLKGEIRLPGDKSISHRAAILTALSSGRARISNFATSVDCASTLDCLRQLGVEISSSGSDVTVTGVGKHGFRSPDASLDCGNSGTTMRLLAGMLAGQDFDSVLIGDDSLLKRPMKRIIEPLTQMGARIESENGLAPLKILGGRKLSGIKYPLPVASAQIKSCVLLAGLNAGGRTTVIETVPTRDHTERMLRSLGANVSTNATQRGTEISIDGDAELAAADIRVPGDISSAAFFLVAAACLKDSELKLINVGLNPTRAAVIDVLRGFGVDIAITDIREVSGEPVGTITVRGGIAETSRASQTLEASVIANLIDEIPILAVFGTQLRQGLEIRGASELRVKESDRIAAVVENLRRMGASVVEFPDGFRVDHSELKGAHLDSFGDHRIAMAFAVAGLMAKGETTINNAECADVSFPGFFDTLARVIR